MSEPLRQPPPLAELASAARLLVATDFDGVLAPIAPVPEGATPSPGVVAALETLAAADRTDAAVISGRAVGDLRRRLGLEGDAGRLVTLVGGHGAEREGEAPPAPPEAIAAVERALRELTANAPGALVEPKPSGVALHYRLCAREHVPALVAGVEALASRTPGARLRRGHEALEVSLSDADKGRALEALRRTTGATRVLFIGDDLTDEDAFRVLRPGDVGVKVGPGPTHAGWRVDTQAQAAELLGEAAALRRAIGAGDRPTPIERHALLSDQRALALADERGRIVWMCAPRPDSPALFAELLDTPRAGVFAVCPADSCGRPGAQQYAGRTLILTTRWEGVTLTDYLDCSRGRPFQRAGRSELVRVVEGAGPVRIEFAPRLDFGRVHTRLSRAPDGLVVEGCLDPIVLRAPGVEWEIRDEGHHHTALGRATLRPGEPLVLELRLGTGDLRASTAPEAQRREQTAHFWSAWCASLRLPSVSTAHADLVARSALTLKALTHAPSGAILAAATTSVPEWPGGERNWDYRYCWPRDAAIAAASLVRLGNTGVAVRFLDWLLGVLDRTGSPERLAPLYTVSGHEPPPEGEIGALRGYARSAPVRVGNGAASQVQLDVFGPIVDLVALLAERDAPLSGEHWRLVEAMVTAVERRWREADHGIWEVRSERRRHTHSRIMCWHAAQRACALAEAYFNRPRTEWAALRDEIAADTLERCVDPATGALVAADTLPRADASCLLGSLCGMIPADDPRARATVALVERELLAGPTVYRYRYDDDLPGGEGGFHLCAGWLVQARLREGRTREARELFDAMCACAGPTGLMPEQWDPVRRESLGNTPQAYSHAAIIDAADALARAGA